MASKKRYKSLDLLKLILSILIVFHHFQQDTATRFNLYNFYDGSFYYGNLVELFFIVSGFLIAINSNKIAKTSLKDFLFSKIKRLYPMIFLTIIMTIIVNYIYFIKNGTYLFDLEINIFSIIVNLLLIPQLFYRYGFNNPLWYVEVLIICYLLYWLVLSIKKIDNKKILFVYIFVIFCSLVLRYFRINFLFLNKDHCRGYISFFIGVILYEIYQKIKSNKIFKFSIVFSICFFLFARSCNYNWYILTFIFFPSLVLTMLSIDDYINININGNISFYIYIWHCFFINLLKLLETFNIDLFNKNYSFIFMLLFTSFVILFCMILCFIEKNIKNNFKEKKI